MVSAADLDANLMVKLFPLLCSRLSASLAVLSFLFSSAFEYMCVQEVVSHKSSAAPDADGAVRTWGVCVQAANAVEQPDQPAAGSVDDDDLDDLFGD